MTIDGVPRAFELATMPLVPSIPFPRGWPRLAKDALLHAVSLARAALVEVHSGFENSPLARARQAAEIDRLRSRVALLEEILRIKDRRMELIAAAERPRYPSDARLAILILRAAEGWSAAETAQRFLLARPTIGAWMRRLDEEGEEALVRLPEPVNRFPDFVAALVQKLKASLPSMGKVRMAQLLARAGLVLSASTAKRLAERQLALPEPPRPRAGRVQGDASTGARRVVEAKRPGHVWHVDLSIVPTGLGFFVPWFPFSLPVTWPFCFWVAVVIDHFSRAVVAKQSFLKEPSAGEVCKMLDRAVENAGRAPPHMISDRGPQFGGEYRAWCARHGAKPRFGKVGEHGSIAIMERFFRSMKQECFRRLSVVPFALAAFEAELQAYANWYNDFRPHRALDGRTPAEVRDGLAPASERPALEPRPRYPLARAGPSRRKRRRLLGRLEISITHFRNALTFRSSSSGARRRREFRQHVACDARGEALPTCRIGPAATLVARLAALRTTAGSFIGSAIFTMNVLMDPTRATGAWAASAVKG